MPLEGECWLDNVIALGFACIEGKSVWRNCLKIVAGNKLTKYGEWREWEKNLRRNGEERSGFFFLFF